MYKRQTYHLLIDVVEEQAAGIPVRQEDKAFIADFYKYAFVGLLLDWIRQDVYKRQVYTASMAVRTEYSVVNTVSRTVSANWPMKAKLTQPSGTTLGRSPAVRGIKKAVM